MATEATASKGEGAGRICGVCGYNMAGLGAGRSCPECGAAAPLMAGGQELAGAAAGVSLVVWGMPGLALAYALHVAGWVWSRPEAGTSAPFQSLGGLPGALHATAAALLFVPAAAVVAGVMMLALSAARGSRLRRAGVVIAVVVGAAVCVLVGAAVAGRAAPPLGTVQGLGVYWWVAGLRWVLVGLAGPALGVGLGLLAGVSARRGGGRAALRARRWAWVVGVGAAVLLVGTAAPTAVAEHLRQEWMAELVAGGFRPGGPGAPAAPPQLPAVLVGMAWTVTASWVVAGAAAAWGMAVYVRAQLRAVMK